MGRWISILLFQVSSNEKCQPLLFIYALSRYISCPTCPSLIPVHPISFARAIPCHVTPSVVVTRPFRGVLLSLPVERVHANVLAALVSWHTECLPSCVRVDNVLAKPVLGDVGTLRYGSVAHVHHRAQKVECVGGISACKHDDEEHEEERVSQN